MNNQLQGKIAVVTGGGRGVGRCIALALAERGAQVALAARSGEQVRSVAQEIRDAGGVAHGIAADVSRPGSVQSLKEEVTAKLGVPAILVNAAGVFGPIQLIKDSDPQQWIETLMINTVAPYLTCRAFVGDMVAAGWGRIINVTSAAALHPPGPLNSAYGTSKVALNQFTRHLAAEVAGTGVTANVFHPGEVKTEMWCYIRDEANRMGPEGDGYRQWVKWVDESGGDAPEKSAAVALKLIESGAINGQFLWIEGGLQSPIPSW